MEELPQKAQKTQISFPFFVLFVPFVANNPLFTRKRNPVQVVQVIYGVSMGSDSASTVISLKLDEFVAQTPDE